MPKIQFIEKTHQYFSEDGELTSVSKFTDGFTQKVDWQKVAKGVASKLTKVGTPTTSIQVLEKWEKKRNQSATIGILYHAIREEELISEHNVYKRIVSPIYEGDKMSIPINEIQNNTIYPEMMIYDVDYMICGQSDKVIVENNKIHVWDYKTDAEISFKGWSNQWTSPKKFLPPLSHLDDCNGNKYAIKMSLYMYMLWKANKGRFKPGNIIIEHVSLKRNPDNDNIPVLVDGHPVELGRKTISVPYLKKEVMAMLKTIKL